MRGRTIAGAITAVLLAALLAAAGPAAAKARHHHQNGKGGPAAPMTIQIDPNPVVETSQSDVLAVVQVKSSPSFAGEEVELESSQFFGSCGPSSDFADIGGGFGVQLLVQLDNEGNATVSLGGLDCAPGSDLIEASMQDAPFLTASTTLTVSPPSVTTPGLYGFPNSSGTVTGGEVETGDSGSTASSVYAVFYVETDPVYAEQSAQISSPELKARCGASSAFGSFINGNETFGTTSVLDDDGNAAYFFVGASCAAGSSVVTADVEAGTHPTYTTVFNILPPQPTI